MGHGVVTRGVWLEGGGGVTGGVHPLGTHTPPLVNKRAVRILLGCFIAENKVSRTSVSDKCSWRLVHNRKVLKPVLRYTFIYTHKNTNTMLFGYYVTATIDVEECLAMFFL